MTLQQALTKLMQWGESDDKPPPRKVAFKDKILICKQIEKEQKHNPGIKLSSAIRNAIKVLRAKGQTTLKTNPKDVKYCRYYYDKWSMVNSRSYI